MKNRFKNFFNKKIRLIISYFFSKDYKPYKIKSLLFPEKSYSDFFIYRVDYFKNIFIAENMFNLLNIENNDSIHIFNFYNASGKFIDKYEFHSKEYISEIELPIISSKDIYISFTHECFFESKNKNLDKRNSKVFAHHRGYTCFQKNKNSLGSVAHGNFGGIASSNVKKSAARQSNKIFFYSPSYLFKNNDNYHLVFNNPTSRNLEINILYNYLPNRKSERLVIKSFGANYHEVINYEGLITFKSKLPVCRCLIFKNPDKEKQNFDVLHS